VKDAEAFRIAEGLYVGAKAGKALLQVCLNTAEISAAVITLALRDRYGDVLFLYKIVAGTGSVEEYFVCFMAVIVQTIALFFHKHPAFKLCGVEPVVYDG